ncbi:MAG: DUF2817 domain-containing protein, partial [Rhodoferax sp.]|nr:DUF2817 domain-containing protein [Rhodoferax sp.]
PQVEYTGIAMEYGTLPMEQVMHALRGEHWLHVHPYAESALKTQIKQDILRAFYTDTDAWREQIVSQAREALFQAASGLAS